VRYSFKNKKLFILGLLFPGVLPVKSIILVDGAQNKQQVPGALMIVQ
jgi:hypothetical protein